MTLNYLKAGLSKMSIIRFASFSLTCDLCTYELYLVLIVFLSFFLGAI